ncbi:helix-turn-helix domain-containing protein [Moorena sp. SIO3I8]|uniref:helix-turn-helix domain-containing protein n=1 Tax=Moorena sp. SIO3I8 TaxID=2607833 RepID=UPI0013C27902|nr:helix-turn-helix domain-containing protein [Moorena sp. SIO3I8]NEO10591.1 transposase [Moorena sp. SIO3I8]
MAILGHQLRDNLRADQKGAGSTTGRHLTSLQQQLLQKSLELDISEKYRQRIQIMLLADQGQSQAEIRQALGCCPATARHWILMARTGQALNWQDNPIGRPKAVNEQYLERLQELVKQSPRDCGYSFRRWTAHWLSKHLAKELGVEITPRHVNRLLKEMGLSTRPRKSSKAQSKTTENGMSGVSIMIHDLQSAVLPDSSAIMLSYTNRITLSTNG